MPVKTIGLKIDYIYIDDFAGSVKTISQDIIGEIISKNQCNPI